MLISLVICTYNREDILRETLPSVLALKIPIDAQLELIIVDNNSIDDTAAFVKDFIGRNTGQIAMTYLFEVNQGLSYARNSGYKKAVGDYIVYTDDECILPENWILNACTKIKQFSPAFLGGPYYGKYLSGSKSPWYKESYGDSYILQFNLPNGPMNNRYLSGGNLFIRRDVFEKIGLFNVELGMTGETINYGEEVDFQKRLKAYDPNEIIWYDESVYVYHCIRNEKMSICYLFMDAMIRGASAAELRKPSKIEVFASPFLLFYFILRALLSFVQKAIFSLMKKQHFFSLLHSDYESRVWRDIGSAWFRVKSLFSTN